MFRHRRGHGPDGHQHIHADRFSGVGRLGVQERHPYRRVCQGPARVGKISVRGDVSRLPIAASSHHHDVVCVYSGRGAARDFSWGRRVGPHPLRFVEQFGHFPKFALVRRCFGRARGEDGILVAL